MAHALVVLDKYSDWLETYSLFNSKQAFSRIEVCFIENDRNDFKSVEGVYQHLLPNHSVSYYSCETREDLFVVAQERCLHLKKGDYFIAPFIRYRHFWKLIKTSPKGVTKVHLSEVIPDTFGLIGYRLAFRGRNWKSWLTFPFAFLYALTHKPDVCFFPLYPILKNPFVRKSDRPIVPSLTTRKKEWFTTLLGGEKRPLIISGFGYDLELMVRELSITKYIATSKGKEIIIDGQVQPLSERICAEEVLLSGLVSEIIGYNSAAMLWAKIIDPKIKITCYEAEGLNKSYGSLYAKFSRQLLSKFEIDLLPIQSSMITE